MPIQPAVPKYALIANALQARIAAGDYRVGDMLPSEVELVREFAASRSTVIKALHYLKHLGYVEGVQGVGRVVLGVPPPRKARPPARVYEALYGAEAAAATLIAAGPMPATSRVALALSIPVGGPVVARQRLMASGRPDHRVLSAVYVPAEAAEGTDLHARRLLLDGVVEHFERRRRLRVADVVETLWTRSVSAREAAVLGLKPDASVLTSLLIVRNAAGAPLLVSDLVIPVPAQGLEDIYQLRGDSVQ